jgi:membrane fusion protein (multidrug efflux system)
MNPTLFGLLLLAALVAFWCGWLALGRVTVYEISASARLEVARVHPVAAVVGGRVVRSHLALGREVRSGDVLVDIEADREEMETNEERTRLATLTHQLAAIDREIATEEQAIVLADAAARASLSESEQRLAAVQATERQADDQQRRVRQLDEHGLVAASEVVRATAEAEARQADAAAMRLAIERIRAQNVAAEREQRAHLGALVRERVTLQGERDAVATAVARREREADERRIRAAVDGRIGEMAPLEVGAVVREGDRVASIVPAGQGVKAVAEFLPPAFGRVRAGQRARLRFDGFPWMQYGHVAATVDTVASETRDGRVRVELTVHPAPSSSIPLEHGLPATAEIEIERVAPVALLIRTLGRSMETAAAPVGPPAAAERSSR